ncbi:hypothetical protein QR685DRAFT_530844 [Neurospora intermedia]|uniref:Uncharacterized protein n=1 Tax=Neurospora intermedia TaxID=5142 RepID=A0ABR3D6Z1_NEUIN
MSDNKPNELEFLLPYSFLFCFCVFLFCLPSMAFWPSRILYPWTLKAGLLSFIIITSHTCVCVYCTYRVVILQVLFAFCLESREIGLRFFFTRKHNSYWYRWQA